MSTPVSSLRNLGPVFETACSQSGIGSAEELRALGADAAYARLVQHGTRPHFIGYYVLVMALQDRPWNDCKGEEKKALRARFDAIKTQSYDADLTAFEQVMDQIGVRPSPRSSTQKGRHLGQPSQQIRPDFQPTSSRPEKK